MELLGFVIAAPAVSLATQVAGFVGLAATTVGAAIGINAVIDSITPAPSQSPVDDPVSFEPWGDDPYEEEPEPEPEPYYAPLAESPTTTALAPALTPVQEPPAVESTGTQSDPQAPITPEFVAVPHPDTPGASGRLGGHAFTFDLGNPEATTGITLRFSNWSSKVSPSAWNAISYEVFEHIEAGQITYQPAVRVLYGNSTAYLWEVDERYSAIPSLSKYGTTVHIPLTDGSILDLPIEELITDAKHLYEPLPYTFKPTTLPEPEEEEKALLPYEPVPLPELEPEKEEEPLLPPPVPTAPEPTTTPTIPDAVPLPISPTSKPILDESGKPVYVSPVHQTGTGTHVIDTGDSQITVPGDTARPDLSQIAKELQRVEGKAAQILKNTNANGSIWDRLPELILLLQGLADLFEQPLPEKVYSISGVCEEPLADGVQPSTTVILPAEKWAERVISLGDMMPELLQAHLGYKTPTCTARRPELEGEWVTTRWISDEKMDHSGRVLRKHFRYRSKSGAPLEQLSTYWKRFVWQAGPVCVIHKGAWWGTPQVWAATAEEGKRLIRFAGQEAGLDPDQIGEWEVSGSRSPRYGMFGTMRIQYHKGFPWVSAREGPDWPNMLAMER